MSGRQGPAAIASLLERHGVVPRKAYGQHFLADPNLVDKVISVAGVSPGDAVVEVGAGTGALTAALVDAGARVLAYEVDRRLRPVLDETLRRMEVDLRFEDVMTVDLGNQLSPGRWKLVANLPYNVGTPLLLDILVGVPAVVSMTVMVQREVADRLVARSGTSAYGLPSVVVGLTARLVERFVVPPQVFVPPPRVGSMVVRLDRVDAPHGLGTALELARSAFSQRRKMLRSSLPHISGPAFAAAGIDPIRRPETLQPEEFVALAEVTGA